MLWHRACLMFLRAADDKACLRKHPKPLAPGLVLLLREVPWQAACGTGVVKRPPVLCLSPRQTCAMKNRCSTVPSGITKLDVVVVPCMSMPCQSGSTYLSRHVRTLRDRLHHLQHSSTARTLQMVGRSLQQATVLVRRRRPLTSVGSALCSALNQSLFLAATPMPQPWSPRSALVQKVRQSGSCSTSEHSCAFFLNASVC